jgi:hypothetical protein
MRRRHRAQRGLTARPGKSGGRGRTASACSATEGVWR